MEVCKTKLCNCNAIRIAGMTLCLADLQHNN